MKIKSQACAQHRRRRKSKLALKIPKWKVKRKDENDKPPALPRLGAVQWRSWLIPATAGRFSAVQRVNCCGVVAGSLPIEPA